jgi:hypothetical protein
LPVRNYQTRADFARDYSSPYWPWTDPANGLLTPRAFPGVDQTYDHREFGLRIGAVNANVLIVALNLQPADSLLIVGAGFGWTIEVLESLGFTAILGIDTSDYVQTAKTLDDETVIDAALIAGGLNPLLGDGANIKANAHSPGPRTRCSRGIPNEDIGNGASRGRVRQFLGVAGNDKIVTGISEQVFDGLTDAECVTLSDRMNDVCDRVVHFVTDATRENDGVWNLKTLEGWKTLIPGDEFLDTNGRLV